MGGVWSAAPTPLTENLEIDRESVKRMVAHHLRLGVNGLFLCGTAGEGPMLTDAMRTELLDAVVEHNAGRMLLAVQVTDNSSLRILENMEHARKHGMDIAVVAPPFFFMNATPEHVASLYLDSIRESPLPVGIYDRGDHSSVKVPTDILAEIIRHEKVVMLKDSSSDAERMHAALAVREKRDGLYLLNGCEFDCVTYLHAGYDGLLLGGGVFNGYLAARIVEAVRRGDLPAAEELQARMTRLMYDVFGGEEITCWLTGQKQLLVEMGIFGSNRNLYGYPLTDSCREAITAALKREADLLFPE